MTFTESIPSRLLAGMFALVLPFPAISAPLVTGASVPALVLEDQHGKKVSIEAGTRIVLFAADKAASDFVNETLAAQPAGVLDRLNAVYFADISAMPALITRMFALPALRELPFAKRRFEHAAVDIGNTTDPAKAPALVKEGRDALAKGDGEALRRVVQKLWQLSPGDPEQRRLGYDSGVR